MSIQLDKAIEAFEDEHSKLTLGDRINLLRDALMFDAFSEIKKINSGSKRNDEEDYKRTECMKLLKVMEKMYDSQLKTNKITGKTEEVMSNDFLKQIKAQKSTIGDIVGSTQNL